MSEPLNGISRSWPNGPNAQLRRLQVGESLAWDNPTWVARSLNIGRVLETDGLKFDREIIDPWPLPKMVKITRVA